MKPARDLAFDFFPGGSALSATERDRLTAAIEQDRREVVDDRVSAARGLLYSWLHVTHPHVIGCVCNLCERSRKFIDDTRAPAPVEPTPARKVCPTCHDKVYDNLPRGTHACSECYRDPAVPAPPPAVTCASWCGTAQPPWWHTTYCTDDCRRAGRALHPAAQPKCETCGGERGILKKDGPSSWQPCPACSPGGERP